MTARSLQRDLMEEMKKLFSDTEFRSPDGGTRHFSVYGQALPVQASEDEADPFPYIIVRIESGEIKGPVNPHEVRAIILVGIFDDDPANQGHIAVLESLERIQARFEGDPVLAERYRREPGMEWALQSEESFPYFFGAIEMTFETPPPRVKWSELV